MGLPLPPCHPRCSYYLRLVSHLSQWAEMAVLFLNHALFRVPSCLPDVLYLSLIPSRMPHHIRLPHLLRLLSILQALGPPLFPMTLQGVCRLPLCWGFSDVFSWLGCSRGLGRKPTQVEFPSQLHPGRTVSAWRHC